MMDWSVFGYSLVTSLLLVTLFFFIARRHERYDLGETGWGLIPVAIAWTSYLGQIYITFWSVQTAITLLVTIWGLRLAYHAQHRWKIAHHKTKRFKDLRSQYRHSPGGLGLNMYVRNFLPQVLVGMVISLPIMIANATPNLQPDLLTFIGVLIWAIGFYYEAVGDAQLLRFNRNYRNKGRVMTQGLWRYTRHPNYFGEVLQWGAIFIMVLAAPHWYASITGFIFVTLLIVYVSGIPVIEKQLTHSTGWKAYKKRTSVFFPLPPRGQA